MLSIKTLTRNDARILVERMGGHPENSVTKRTNILVIGEQDLKVVGVDGLSRKMKKAQDLLEKGQDIEILTENDFIKFIE